MTYINISIPVSDIGNACSSDGELFAYLINEVGQGSGDGTPPRGWLNELVETLDDDGKALIRHLAAAIEAEDEGGGS